MTEPTAEKNPAPIAEKQPAKKPSVWPGLSKAPSAPMPYTAVYDWGKVQFLSAHPEMIAKSIVDFSAAGDNLLRFAGVNAQLYTLVGFRALYPSFPGEWPPFEPVLPPDSKVIQVVNITLFNVAAPVVLPDRRSETHVQRDNDGQIVKSVTVETTN